MNSVNLEAGRDKLDTVVPLAKAHGAALIALTIDEVGMAKTRDRKLEIAQRIQRLVCDEHGLDPELADLRRAHLHAHHRRRGVAPVGRRDDRGHQLIKEEIPQRQDLAGRLQRVVRRLAQRAPGAQLGLPAPLRGGRPGPGDGAPRRGHALPRDPRQRARAHRRPGLQPAPRTRSRSSSSTSSPRARRPRTRPPTPPRTWSPRRRCTGTSCGARRRASRTGSTSATRRSAPSPR